MIAQETAFAKVAGVFQSICEFLQEAQGMRLDEVEREIHTRLAQEGLAFLEEYVEQEGPGDEGESVTLGDRELKRSDDPMGRRYLSVFGELSIDRYVYLLRAELRSHFRPNYRCRDLRGDLAV